MEYVAIARTLSGSAPITRASRRSLVADTTSTSFAIRAAAS
jgi:hypothetical protein